MARDRKAPNPNDAAWARAERAFQLGSPEFVEVVRAVADAKRLATFAEAWYTESRIEAKRLLFAYLERPFNSPRHEPLVKRLFKFADAAGDDAVMARFLAGFDRTIRRRRSTVEKYNYKRRQYEQHEAVATPGNTVLREISIPQLWHALNQPSDNLVTECRYFSRQHFLDDGAAEEVE